MRVIDASSIVHAWDNYPIENFPKFWDWVNGEFSSKKLLIPWVAFEEVGHVCPQCHQWLKDQSVISTDVNMAIAKNAQNIKKTLGIANDDYSTGVDENDIVIIATAKTLSHTLVSNEAKQASPPKNLKKYKIPAVCALPSIDVACINIAELIRQSRQTF